MDESSGNTFANRSSPIPIVRFSSDASSEHSQDKENALGTASPQGKEQSRRWLFRQKAKDILSSGPSKGDGPENEPAASKSMQDRFLEKCVPNILSIPHP